MAISDAQLRATNKYSKAHYDKIILRVKKGEREKIKWDIFQLEYDSVNKFCLDAIYEKIEREKAQKDAE